MVSFEKFKVGDGPIYQQIVMYIKRGISSKTIVEGDEMPSRRVLSALLGVNPNTIQKAYKLLEDEGIIQSHSGTKSIIVLKNISSDEIKKSLVYADVKAAVDTLRQTGITKSEAITLLEKFWTEGD